MEIPKDPGFRKHSDPEIGQLPDEMEALLNKIREKSGIVAEHTTSPSIAQQYKNLIEFSDSSDDED